MLKNIILLMKHEDLRIAALALRFVSQTFAYSNNLLEFALNNGVLENFEHNLMI